MKPGLSWAFLGVLALFIVGSLLYSKGPPPAPAQPVPPAPATASPPSPSGPRTAPKISGPAGPTFSGGDWENEAVCGDRWKFRLHELYLDYANGAANFARTAPKVGEPETLLEPWIRCLGRFTHPAVTSTQTAAGVHRRYVLFEGHLAGPIYYDVDNEIITAVHGMLNPR